MDFREIIAVLAALTGEPVEPERHFGAIATGGHDASAPVEITACPRPIGMGEIEGETMICGTVSVPENHDAPDAKRIDLLFTVLKSHSEVPEPDPLLYLHGGPGMGNMNGLKGLAQIFDGWRQTRDVITFDQRAAGLSSGEAACSGVINSNVRAVLTMSAGRQEITGCIEELRNSDITLQHYNTLQNAFDVPMVMGTLGYDSYNIIGISYGTKLTLEVMRSAPEGLRSVISPSGREIAAGQTCSGDQRARSRDAVERYRREQGPSSASSGAIPTPLNGMQSYCLGAAAGHFQTAVPLLETDRPLNLGNQYVVTGRFRSQPTRAFRCQFDRRGVFQGVFQ